MRAVVVGGGTMGSGIAAVLVAAGYVVDVVDDGAAKSAHAAERAHAAIRDAVARGQLTADLDEAAQHLRPAPSLGACEPQPDVLIEAVPERAELKRAVLATAEELEPRLLATNTSAISIEELARSLRRPERLIGLHFFNPVPTMALVEVVIGRRTGGGARDCALETVAQLGKEPIVVRSAPGFATSRLGIALALEAIRMVEDGVAAPEDIDRSMTLGYRHPVGPLRLTDIVGLDVRLDIARNLRRAYGERFRPPALLARMVQQGKLGRKTGCGFYLWSSP